MGKKQKIENSYVNMFYSLKKEEEKLRNILSVEVTVQITPYNFILKIDNENFTIFVYMRKAYITEEKDK